MRCGREWHGMDTSSSRVCSVDRVAVRLMRVEADKRLFDEFRSVSQRVATLASIVQNNHRITRTQFAEWKKQMSLTKDKLDRLSTSVALHIDRCNR
jgi:hypothetical protein